MKELIRAQLTVTCVNQTHLAIGNGQVDDTKYSTAEETQCEVQSLLRGVNGQPVLSASSLKGAISNKVSDQGLKARLFGATTTVNNSLVKTRGSVNIYAALSEDEITSVTQTRNAIDPITGAAKTNHLFAQEWLKPQSKFTLNIEAAYICPNDLDALLKLLSQPLQLGRDKKNNFGLLSLHVDECKVLYKEKLQDWIGGKSPLATLYQDYAIPTPQPSQQDNQVTLGLALYSPDPILIACPERQKQEKDKYKKAVEAYELKKSRGELVESDKLSAKPKDYYFKRNHDGKPFLPVTALRGVLQAQSKRIVRTLLPTNRDEQAVMQLVSPLWGDEKRQAGVFLTDAELVEPGEYQTHQQNMIAINRFTGGVKDGAMIQVEALETTQPFNCTLKYRPNLHKDLTATAILLMTLRDVMEQHIAIGANKSKGYGRLQGVISFNGSEYRNFSDFFNAFTLQYELNMADLETALAALAESKGA
ncbi:RAMP superfamily CRISPR-associated protein [Pseudoalteromonas piscicida]|uniref:RAMP superfamily CRISPR-associated protein n=1 Tax=Pseudoalteromonas piscicida TaxID=43662 RepID=UPI0027E54E97|nr:RAMP superfamily CRISPR-associated protein [Pseudoalteromonas piscicida]WMO14007.1 RAMP superfamily CRISPR-associated protein [Pseudoalteromonas piscicida]